ncbi:MAG: ABC transporter ATP-binding protein, partial [Rhodobacteraceae bacterium]|nr:ABC transporter ATP-binding protein [Paracoccaceae bacterium]
SHDMHLLSLVADRLWLVKDGGVAPYLDDLDSYRAMLLGEGTDRPKAEKPARPKASREQVLALKAEVRKCEQRVEKLEDMREKLAAKLADPALYEDDRKGDRDVWNRKYAEVMDGLDRAEALWMKSVEALENAES